MFYLSKQMGKEQLDDLELVTKWTNYNKDLGWNCLGLQPSEMMELMEDREVWRLNLELLLKQSLKEKWAMKKEEGILYMFKEFCSTVNTVCCFK